MGEVALLSLTAALNPTLLAVSTMMMLLPSPKRLMLGYWVGAMMTSITLGLVIVSSLEGSTLISTTNTPEPGRGPGDRRHRAPRRLGTRVREGRTPP